MLEYRNVIVLQDARAGRDNLVQGLAKRDFAVRSCGSLQGFRHLYALHPSPLVVLIGEPDDLARHTENARVVAPAATIVALGATTATDWRVRILAAGADACHAASIEIIELAAILSSWARHAARVARAMVGGGPAEPYVSRTDRMGQGPRPSPGRAGTARFLHEQSTRSRASSHGTHPTAHDVVHNVTHHASNPGDSDTAVDSGPVFHPHLCSRLATGWRLDANCRVLVCPRDQTLFLTGAENSFLMRIAASEGQLLRRRRAVNGAAQDIDRPDGSLDARGMDVLVSRLRRKARSVGIQLPLLAVRGCGYLFAEYLSVTPSGPPRPAGRSPSVASRSVSLAPTGAHLAVTNLSTTQLSTGRPSALSRDGLSDVAPQVLIAIPA